MLAGDQGATAESFCLQKVYGGVHSPLERRRTGATKSPARGRQGRCLTGIQDAHTRHVGTACRHKSAGSRRHGGGGKGEPPEAGRGVVLSHQTLAKPEPRRDSAETGGCAAAAWRSGA